MYASHSWWQELVGERDAVIAGDWSMLVQQIECTRVASQGKSFLLDRCHGVATVCRPCSAYASQY